MVKGKQFTGYERNDGEFKKEMEYFSRAALQKVLEYRQFEDMDYAKKRLIEKLQKTSEDSRLDRKSVV